MMATTIERRTFLKMGLMTAGAIALTGCKVQESYEAVSNQARTITAKDAVMNRLIQYAALAPNSHNSQPWRFRLTNDGIEIHPDLTRRLSAVDPNDRELWISLGCALENLTVAGAAEGYESEIQYPEKNKDFISVNLHASSVQKNPLFDAIPLRQSNRSVYLDKKVEAELVEGMHAVQSETDVRLLFIDNKTDLVTVTDYVNAGNLKQFANPVFMEELISWLRFNKKEALSTKDGLFTKCTGNPTVPRWLGEMFVSGTKPQAQVEADAKKLCSSAGAVVIASSGDEPVDWVHCGQIYERLSLTLASLGLSSALLNQPIEEPTLREEFARAVGFQSEFPQVLLRYGYAEPMPYSLRRPVEDVLMD